MEVNSLTIKQWITYNKKLPSYDVDKYLNQFAVPLVINEKLTIENVSFASRFYDTELKTDLTEIKGVCEINAETPESGGLIICLERASAELRFYAQLYSRAKNGDFRVLKSLDDHDYYNYYSYVVFFFDEPPSEEILSGIIHLPNSGVFFGDPGIVGFMVAKSLTRQSRFGPFVILNMLDDSRTAINMDSLYLYLRHSSPFARLQEHAQEGPIELLTIAAHGNGSDVYIGTNKISSVKKDKCLTANELPILGVFLDTCFGFKWGAPPGHPSNVPALWESFCVGPTRFLVAYWGVKDNSSIECDIFSALVGAQKPLGQSVAFVNNFLEFSGQDVGYYLLYGDPSIHIQPCKAAAGLVSEENLNGSQRIEYLSPQRFSPRDLVDTLESLRLLSPKYQGQIREWSNSYTSLGDLYPLLTFQQKARDKYERTVQRIVDLRKKVIVSLLEDVTATAQESFVPFSEQYSSRFVLADHQLGYAWCWCGIPLLQRRLRSVLYRRERLTLTCPVCGMVQDHPADKPSLEGPRGVEEDSSAR